MKLLKAILEIKFVRFLGWAAIDFLAIYLFIIGVLPC
jgi:hypothetical protein